MIYVENIMKFTFLCMIFEALFIYGLNFMFGGWGQPPRGGGRGCHVGFMVMMLIFVVLIAKLSFLMEENYDSC